MAMTASERRRVRFVFLLLGFVPVFLAGWLGWVQVLQAGALPRQGGKPLQLSARAADVQRDRGERRPGARGTIVDRHGAALAMDCEAFEVRAEVRPPRAARADAASLRTWCTDLARRLAGALCRDPGLADRAAARAEHESRLQKRLLAAFRLERQPDTGTGTDTGTDSGTSAPPGHAEILVASGVAVLAVIDALDELDAGSSSVLLHMQQDHVRVYPERELTWGLVGYLEELPIRGEDGALRAFEPFAPVGLEAMAALQPGAPGARAYRVDSQHRRFFAGAGESAAPATRVETTIDLELQKSASRELERQATAEGQEGGSRPQWGALVLVEIQSGDVLAAASWHRDARTARGAAFTPYQQLYEPGSIVKPLVFAYALEHAGLDWNHEYDCTSSGRDHERNVAEAGGRLVRDDHACGRLSAHGILKYSSNIGAVKIGSLLDRDDWRGYLDFYGFGRSLGLPLPHERTGGPSPKGWLPGITLDRFKKWTGASYSIGYELQVNALQVARAYLTMLAGEPRELRLVRAIDVDGRRSTPPAAAKAAPVLGRTAIEAVTAGMVDVVTADEGATGRHLVAAFNKEGIELHGLLAGKTGTAKSRSTVPGRGSVEVRNASFVGFLPASAPRYLAVCVLQKDDSARFYGGSYAASPAARVLLEALRLEERRRLCQEPQVSVSPGVSGRGPGAPERSQAGR